MSRAAQCHGPRIVHCQSEPELAGTQFAPPAGTQPQIMVHTMSDVHITIGEDKVGNFPVQRGMRVALDKLSYTVRSKCLPFSLMHLAVRVAQL